MNRVLYGWLTLAAFSIQALGQIAFFGRDYDTYKEMFCLDDQSLVGKTILDVAAGPSTFLATLKERGVLNPESRAVDLKYSEDRSQLENAIDAGMRQAFDHYYSGSYVSWPVERQTWYLNLYHRFAKIHQSFLSYHDRFPELFAQGDMRDLKAQFGKKTFDLILSANALFLYADKELDLDFHRDAIISMASVLDQNGEIRITPLDNLKAEAPDFLADLIDNLREHGLHVELKKSCTASTGQWIKRLKDARGEMLVIRLKNRQAMSC